jgi:hypothetical protein
MFQAYFDIDKSFVVEVNQTVGLRIQGAYNPEVLLNGWTYIGISLAKLKYATDEYYTKVCAYIWGPESYESSGCGTMKGHAYSETWIKPYEWETRMGDGLVGYIKTVYIWNVYKALTNLYYTPRRNSEYRRLDRCNPYSMMGSPYCSACDQYKAGSTCFTQCGTRTYEDFWSSDSCSSYTCTNDLCIACYKDDSAKSNNYCTACIDNADLIDGNLGLCKCKPGYYYSGTDTNACLKCHPFCITCTGYGPDKCIECK